MGHRYIELFLDSTPDRGNPRPGGMGRGLDDRDMGMPMNAAPNRSEYMPLARLYVCGLRVDCTFKYLL